MLLGDFFSGISDVQLLLDVDWGVVKKKEDRQPWLGDIKLNKKLITILN